MKAGIKNISVNLSLLFLSVFLFCFSNPNLLVKTGFALAGYFIYFPLLVLIRKNGFLKSILYGGLFGSFSYMFYAYWLSKYHFITLILVCILYFILCGILFFFLKLSVILFKENEVLIQLTQLLVIASFEYLKTKGFLGFSYGVSAYTQWKFLPFIQGASIGGVFALNLLVIYPSVWLSSSFFMPVRKNMKALSLWTFLFLVNIIFGIVTIKKSEKYTASSKSVKILAVQNNESPWKNGIEEHKKNVSNLMKITDQAINTCENIDFVVWPETAVAPSVIYNFYSMKDMQRLQLVLNLLNYINDKSQIFVIGNAHEELSEEGKKIFNNSLVFEPGDNVIPPEPGMYTKIHLVPLSESFPYKKILPHIYNLLLKGNTHFWEKGQDYRVFTRRGLSFSTPICFEDTFGDDCRRFVKNGARCFINLSNDSWSESLVCQNQHLAMSVFRSAENRVPAVRSTSSGQTCIINSCGRVVECAEAFCESFAVGDIPVFGKDFKPSLYTKFGDYAGIIESLFAAGLLIIRGIICIISKKNRGGHGRKK